MRIKCASSPTSELHNLQSLCSAGIPVYLPVSISSIADPPLNLAKREWCALEVTTFTYGSGAYSCLNCLYNLSLGFFSTLFCHFSFSNLNRILINISLTSLHSLLLRLPQLLSSHHWTKLHIYINRMFNKGYKRHCCTVYFYLCS